MFVPIIHKMREWAGLSQEELAEKAEVSLSDIIDIEQVWDCNKLNAKVLFRVLDAINCEIEDLFCWLPEGKECCTCRLTIRSARMRAGKSIREVCDALGVTRGTVNRWENGDNSPSVINAIELGHLFALPLENIDFAHKGSNYWRR